MANEAITALTTSADVTASDIAGALAADLRASGAKAATPGTSGPSRFDFVAVRLPNGQEFTIRIEEN